MSLFNSLKNIVNSSISIVDSSIDITSELIGIAGDATEAGAKELAKARAEIKESYSSDSADLDLL